MRGVRFQGLSQGASRSALAADRYRAEAPARALAGTLADGTGAVVHGAGLAVERVIHQDHAPARAGEDREVVLLAAGEVHVAHPRAQSRAPLLRAVATAPLGDRGQAHGLLQRIALPGSTVMARLTGRGRRRQTLPPGNRQGYHAGSFVLRGDHPPLDQPVEALPPRVGTRGEVDVLGPGRPVGSGVGGNRGSGSRIVTELAQDPSPAMPQNGNEKALIRAPRAAGKRYKHCSEKSRL